MQFLSETFKNAELLTEKKPTALGLRKEEILVKVDWELRLTERRNLYDRNDTKVRME
jgi:hypothetical protein